MDPLRKILAPERLTAIVDVGANPIDGKPPYLPMLNAGMCTLVGFEPQRDALDRLLKDAGPNETYLGVALGDGNAHTLTICRSRGMSSILEPNVAHLQCFNDLAWLGAVESREQVQTWRLDDVPACETMDFLKIDAQGAELMIFQNGRERLSRAVAVQTEVSLLPIYKGQPTIGDIDREMRSLGFVPHAIPEFKGWRISPLSKNVGDDRVWTERRAAIKQIMEMDILYVRDFTDDGNMDREQWKHLALVAHHCYGSCDLTARCIQALGSAVYPGFLDAYCAAVSGGSVAERAA